nr:DUF1349 domain-containing protein [uncultured Friedmanniella sp.]
MTTIDGLPALAWTHGEGQLSYQPEGGVLTLTSAAGVDWIHDARSGQKSQTATSWAFRPADGDFLLSVRARVEPPRTTFDAAVLTLWADADHWAKLCFEYSPQGEPMVVSVVTDDYSDDSNGPVVAGNEVHLRVARLGPAWAFHFSTDGLHWHFVRVFRLGTPAPTLVGFLAQAPTGPSCTVHFDQVSYTEETLADLRDGR